MSKFIKIKTSVSHTQIIDISKIVGVSSEWERNGYEPPSKKIYKLLLDGGHFIIITEDCAVDLSDYLIVSTNG